MVDDYNFDKQFKNMGIDKNAVKNTKVEGSKLDIIDVSEQEGEKPKQEGEEVTIEGKEEEKKANGIDCEEVKKEFKQMVEEVKTELNSRIDTIKAELNKVLGDFNQKIEETSKEFVEHKKSIYQRISEIEEKFSDAKVESFQKKENNNTNNPEQQGENTSNNNNSEKKNNDSGEGDVSVENIFNFSNAKDFKRI